MLQTSRSTLPGFPPGLQTNPVNDELFSHPLLSADALECLAQQIATTDGVTPGEARRQITDFRTSGPA